MRAEVNPEMKLIMGRIVLSYPAIIPFLQDSTLFALDLMPSVKKATLTRDELEKRLQRTIGKKFQTQLAELMRLLGDPPDYTSIPASFWETAGNEMRTAIMPILLDTAMQQAGELMRKFPIGADWALVNQAAVTWARSYTDQFIRGLMETTRASTARSWEAFFSQAGSVGQSVAEFFETSGMTIGDLEAIFAPTFGDIRAEMIAITETTRASVQGEMALVNQIMAENPNIIMTAIWQTDMDELVCEICSPLEGKARGDGWTEEPPAHPRCRCTIAHEMSVKK